jgi:hypothetical protein
LRAEAEAVGRRLVRDAAASGFDTLLLSQGV